MAKSSINFQKSSTHSEAHNFRKEEPNYLLPKEHRQKNEYWKNEKSARELFEEELKNSNRKGGAIPKFENSNWEAVLNLNENHNLDDVKKVAEHIEKKFNISCTAITIHRDEGHLKDNKAIYNYHAHLNFMTYKDGKQNWRQSLVRSKLADLQTEVANLLNMQRGKEKSEAKRLNHKQYKIAAKEREKTEEKIQNYEYDFREMQKKITALQTENTELKKELHKLNTQANKTKDYEQIEDLKNKIKELENIKNKPMPELENIKEEIKNDFLKETSEEKMSFFKKAIFIIKNPEQLYRKIIDKVENFYKKTKQKIDELERKIRTLELNNSMLEKKNRILEKENNELNNLKNIASERTQTAQILTENEKTIQSTDEELKVKINAFKSDFDMIDLLQNYQKEKIEEKNKSLKRQR